jgi:two-component system phosphate regulon sensor histidine kinase PhoR
MAMDGRNPQELKPLTSVAVETSGGPVSFTLFPVADASPEERRIFLAVASDMYFSAVGEIGAHISGSLEGIFSVEPLFHESVDYRSEGNSSQGDQLILARADVSESSWIPSGLMQVILIPSSMERLYLDHHRRVRVLGLVVFYVMAAGLWTVWLLYRNQKTMAALNAMQTNFVSSVSHELRAPIGALQLLSESLEKERIHDEDKKRDYYRMMNRECRRLGALVSNILSFSRANQTADSPRFISFPPRSVAGECVNLMQPLAREMNRDIELQIDNPIPESVRMDPNAIRQALINLLDNAIKYTPAGTTVSIHLSCIHLPDNDSINFSIFDHGPGIRREDQSRIFEPFFRSGSELTRETQGVGIGLSIVSHIAKLHGGSIRFENLQSGGCAFHLSIPVAVESVEESES